MPAAPRSSPGSFLEAIRPRSEANTPRGLTLPRIARRVLERLGAHEGLGEPIDCGAFFSRGAGRVLRSALPPAIAGEHYANCTDFPPPRKGSA
jgi:hypothetical protein